jgi:hypothetical protein
MKTFCTQWDTGDRAIAAASQGHAVPKRIDQARTAMSYYNVAMRGRGRIDLGTGDHRPQPLTYRRVITLCEVLAAVVCSGLAISSQSQWAQTRSRKPQNIIACTLCGALRAFVYRGIIDADARPIGLRSATCGSGFILGNVLTYRA